VPITDTNFIEQMKEKQGEQLSELLQVMQEKERLLKEKLAVIILAAGLGKRMKRSDKPKVMFELRGKPLIQYVIELALKVSACRIIVVVGHKREQVIEFLTNLLPNLPSPTEGGSEETPDGSEDVSNAVFDFAVQEPQLGTGHAVMQAEPYLKSCFGDVLILSGDVPMLKYETVEKLLEEHRRNKNEATLLTTVFKNPSGYGRIVRGDNNHFVKIVEEKDATDEEKKINEINPAIYIINARVLFESLKKIKPENSQKEYYLTDIFHHIPKEKIGIVISEDEIEVTGVNSIEQLNEFERLIAKR
jgi:bifunctional N-acetylglucosamine-1-phosphate-uridyltransferase/glucosamine-1-phosphate-acetyltransferase GlmU-like protein